MVVTVYPSGEVCISILHPPEEDKYGEGDETLQSQGSKGLTLLYRLRVCVRTVVTSTVPRNHLTLCYIDVE